MNRRQWEARDPNEAFFPVELRPIYMEAGTANQEQRQLFAMDAMHQLPRHRAVVDVSNNNVFTVVTDDYTLVTNEEAYKRAGQVMKEVFQVTSFEDMACFNITMPKTRSFCHIDLIHKSSDFSPWEKDEWTAFLRITNSYNRTRLLRYELGFCRWICLNGMIFGSKSIEFSYAHTRRGIDRVERLEENIGDIRGLEKALIENLHQLKRYYVPEGEMLPILCRAFEIRVNDDIHTKPRRVEELVQLRSHARKLTTEYFSDMGPHGYAALNVLTDYASRPVGVMAPESAMHGLQQKAGEWMEEFISAIRAPDFSFDSYLGEYRHTAEVINSLVPV